jgi:hypothetical protein
MKGVTYRMQKYEAKTGSVRLVADITALLPTMTVNFANLVVQQVANDTAVKQVLDGSGVSTLEYPGYLGFGREVWRKVSVQEMSGESVAQWAAVCIAKWVARGLNQAVLQAIRNDVFTIPAPSAP